MSAKRTYDRSSKRLTMVLWVAVSAAMLGAMLLPLYWFWDRLASRPSILLFDSWPARLGAFHLVEAGALRR
jgi:hypothetical protein